MRERVHTAVSLARLSVAQLHEQVNQVEEKTELPYRDVSFKTDLECFKEPHGCLICTTRSDPIEGLN